MISTRLLRSWNSLPSRSITTVLGYLGASRRISWLDELKAADHVFGHLAASGFSLGCVSRSSLALGQHDGTVGIP